MDYQQSDDSTSHNILNDAPHDTRLDSQTRLNMLRAMMEVRQAESRIQDLFLENVIRGTTHLCDGQEAVSVGMAHALDPKRGDTVTCTYRGHGHALALGMSLQTLMAEMMGKAAGCSKGKGGSMHLTDMAHGLIGTFAVVGAGLPITNGAALTAQINNTGAVAVAIFGDGTANIGAFHEALTLASVWKLPSIFLCENNLYGEYSPFETTSPTANVVDRVAGYAIPTVIVDGQDAEAVHDVMRSAVEQARNGGGPMFIEAKTYRYRGHSRTDPGSYRKAGELEEWLKRDPITILSERMIADGQISQEVCDTMRRDAENAVDAATRWAMEQPYPTIESVTEDVWA